MSKIPPQLREPVLALSQTATAFTLRHCYGPPPVRVLEDFFSAGQNFVERFLKIGRALGELLSDLRNILLKALFYLLAKELLESTIPQTLGVLCRVIGDDVRDQRASQSLRPLVRILGKEWIQRSARTRVPNGGGAARRCRRRTR